MERIHRKMITDRRVLTALCQQLHDKKKTISYTSGAFDILHSGHPRYLYAAKKQGDVLIVGVDSDQLIKVQKGPSRPVNGIHERSFVLACFHFVNFICFLADQEDTFTVLETIKPDVFVISKSTNSDFNRQKQFDLVKQYGGKILALPPMAEIHTTTLIEKIKRL